MSVTFDDAGTVTVTFDDKDYILGVPKVGQWDRWRTSWQTAIREVRAQLTDLDAQMAAANERLELAKSDAQKRKAQKEAEAVMEVMRGFNPKPLYEWQIPWVQGVFEEFGDPLPDPDEWPAWLAADPSLPNQIIDHWQTRPKVSGVNEN